MYAVFFQILQKVKKSSFLYQKLTLASISHTKIHPLIMISNHKIMVLDINISLPQAKAQADYVGIIFRYLKLKHQA